VAALTATSATAEPAAIADKRAEAEAVLAQIEAIDRKLEIAVEAYNSATTRLDGIQQDIVENLNHLSIARTAYRRAQKRLADRLVALYLNGQQSTIEIILGASSLEQLLDRIDGAERISEQDVEIVGQIRATRAEVRAREKKLETARAEQKQVVAQRADRRAWIEGQLADRQDLYDSVKDELDQLIAEEKERQKRLEEEARRREEERQRILSEGGVEVPENIAVPSGIGTAPPSLYGNDVVSIAMQFLGVQYVWGGSSPSGFDCSGLVVYAYGLAGRPGLPHYTGSLWQMGVAVSRDQLQPGDLVFFNGLGHMGIYIGGGQFIHAPHTGDVVKISDMTSGYYLYSFVGARRI
jgi:peptidoglycan hydrolase CwlO-like protein